MNTVLIQFPISPRKRRATDVFDCPNPVPRWLAAILATSLSAGVLMAAVVPGWITNDSNAFASAKITQEATKRNVDAMPLYELPPIYVEADRRTELAKIERERQIDPLKHARARVSLKPPA